MANYQATHNFSPSHRGDNNPEDQSKGMPHPAHHIQGVMGNAMTHPLFTQIYAGSEGEEVMDLHEKLPHAVGHVRINFDPTHTCATCKETARSNHALQVHAREKSHQAFLCTCGIKFKILFTLNRHIAAQAGPQHYCYYCDNNKGFAREDKLIHHLRASHKFGEKAVAQARSQARAKAGTNGLASPAAMTTGTALAVPTSTTHRAVPVAAATGQAGSSAGPAGMLGDGVFDFPMLNAVDIQSFNIGGENPFPGAAEDFAGSHVSGVDFSGDNFAGFDISDVDFTRFDSTGYDFANVDADFDVSGMDSGF